MYMPRGGIIRSLGSPIFSFMRNGGTILRSKYQSLVVC